MMASSGVIMPRSPWLASLGCTKKAGVPVEANVAAILRPTWPDLPMPVTISRPRAAEIRSTAAMKARAEPVVNGGRERGDAAGPGLERAQRRGDQVAAARVGRSLGAQRFRHCRWSGLSGSQPWNSTETGGKRPPARPRRLYHIRFHRVNHSPVSGAAVVGVAVVGVAAAAAGVAQAATAVCSLPPCGGGLGRGVAVVSRETSANCYPHPQPLPTRGRGAHRLCRTQESHFTEMRCKAPLPTPQVSQ